MSGDGHREGVVVVGVVACPDAFSQSESVEAETANGQTNKQTRKSRKLPDE